METGRHTGDGVVALGPGGPGAGARVERGARTDTINTTAQVASTNLSVDSARSHVSLELKVTLLINCRLKF